MSNILLLQIHDGGDAQCTFQVFVSEVIYVASDDMYPETAHLSRLEGAAYVSRLNTRHIEGLDLEILDHDLQLASFVGDIEHYLIEASDIMPDEVCKQLFDHEFQHDGDSVIQSLLRQE